LRIDPAVVSSDALTEAAKTTRRRRRLAKQLRTQVTHRIIQIRVVQQVLEIQRERQVVTAITTAASAATKAAATTSTAKATAWRAAA